MSIYQYVHKVWPIFWTNGKGAWPDGGEIDIIEAVNLQQNNQMAVHSQPGCTHDHNQNEVGLSGERDCNQRSGCTVNEGKPNSLQQQFATAGGGVWATQFDTSGIVYVRSDQSVNALITYTQ